MPSNSLVMQSGGCTHVFNRSLYGLASEHARAVAGGVLYGAPRGLEGILEGRAVNLSAVSESAWLDVADAPGAAIGSTRRALRDEDVGPVFAYLERLGVRRWFIIGGNDSATTGHRLQTAAREIGYDLSVVNVPKTIDNDLAMTDHSPGYGSAARFAALAALGSGRDAEAMRGSAPITITEVMGRDAGWLAAASALARREERDAPHAICVPEVPVDEDAFLAKIEDAYARFGFAVTVVSENARGLDGRVIGSRSEARFVDDFGHEYHDGAASYLAARASARLGVRARYEKPGTIQRSFIPSLSETDAREAEMVGRAAVRAAVEGASDVMMTLVREEDGAGGAYRCGVGMAALSEVGGKVRAMPPEFLKPSEWFVTPAFLRYLSPLVGDIPRLARLI